ncbi:hypothetical protein CCUS01_15415 [Colletotrichum cuscutae]|uniref:Uncharacterized protein n=1 Tax=Colletotrichum cuscutae TaxID=1209917 RepID=A0AAI9VF39_9PEZI|nr:hypothetical protein CCUS01_15415 [Colletotrichum cuscutae]
MRGLQRQIPPRACLGAVVPLLQLQWS